MSKKQNKFEKVNMNRPARRRRSVESAATAPLFISSLEKMKLASCSSCFFQKWYRERRGPVCYFRES